MLNYPDLKFKLSSFCQGALKQNTGFSKKSELRPISQKIRRNFLTVGNIEMRCKKSSNLFVLKFTCVFTHPLVEF